MIRNFFSFIFELAKVVIISLAIVIPVRHFLIQPFYVKGASMEPNFHDNEYLVIDEISYRMREPKRGEVVVFRYPLDPQEFFIKRVIGLPGEKIEFKNGQVVIYNESDPDGMFLDEEYLPEDLRTYSFTDEKPVEIGTNEYFLMGDNRSSSKDSRSFGPVGKSFIVGRVILRGWPVDNIALFNKAPEYNFGSAE